jgi:radical SAM superfamily enzyme YgiQ (UPF0313 family)
VPFPEKPIIPFGKPVHDRLRLEVARGCTRGCRFCQAGMIYRPVRERSPDLLLALGDRSLQATGYEDISLLSLSTGDYGCIVPLIERLMFRHAAQNVSVSLPSLRAGTLTPELMALIKTVRKTGFTIAPEAGSQRLREVINKNISDAEIMATVKDAFDLGWQVIKLYFMIGLPTCAKSKAARRAAARSMSVWPLLSPNPIRPFSGPPSCLCPKPGNVSDGFRIGCSCPAFSLNGRIPRPAGWKGFGRAAIGG